MTCEDRSRSAYGCAAARVKGGGSVHSVTAAGAGALRRTPVQERSAARVQRMLDAAAALLDEVGYDATTTSLIASRAGVSVGSLYQFFPDRRAVLQALAQRSFSRFSAVLSERVTTSRLQRWQDAVGVVVDVFVEFTRTEPAAQVLSFGGPVDRHTLDPQDDNNAVVAESLGEVLRLVRPDLVIDDRLRLALRVAVEAGDRVLELAFRRAPEGDAKIVAETKQLLVSYLAAYLD
ncbi:MAG: TetR family transcriptional regulator [Frankiales bacterium]|jgi:AcrR family transcriptional regulator|nr:TetR family transcriptional regulator [Frankiales bacterium]